MSTGSSTGGTAAGSGATANGGGVTASGGGPVGGGCNAGCGSGAAATAIGGSGSGGLDPFVVRVTALCDEGCASIAEAPGCPDWVDCARDCRSDRTEALKLGCSVEPVMDCVDEHPDANRYFCDDNGIQAFDLESCADVLDAYNGCVLAAKGKQLNCHGWVFWFWGRPFWGRASSRRLRGMIFVPG